MHAGKLDVLADGISDDFAVSCHCIHLHLLGVLHKLAYYHGMFLGHICRKLQETLQFVLV